MSEITHLFHQCPECTAPGYTRLEWLRKHRQFLFKCSECNCTRLIEAHDTPNLQAELKMYEDFGLLTGLVPGHVLTTEAADEELVRFRTEKRNNSSRSRKG